VTAAIDGRKVDHILRAKLIISAAARSLFDVWNNNITINRTIVCKLNSAIGTICRQSIFRLSFRLTRDAVEVVKFGCL
jgi:hypothetical protein